MNIDGISLTPKVLFWAYREAEYKREEAGHMLAVAQSDEKQNKYRTSRAYYYRLKCRIANRLDRKLGELDND